MGFSNLMFLLLISMTVVSIVRCKNVGFEEMEIGNQNNGPVDPSTGLKECVKERVKKVVDKGKELIEGAGNAISRAYEGAGNAISRGYNSIKEKIIGKKQPELISVSRLDDIVEEFTSSDAYTQSTYVQELPSGHVPPH